MRLYKGKTTIVCPKRAGVDTKACENGSAVIPVVARFCAECGASQPKQGA